MSAARWVRNRRGVVKAVAASAVPMLAPGGWTPLTDDEVAAHEQGLVDEREARRDQLAARASQALGTGQPAAEPTDVEEQGTELPVPPAAPPAELAGAGPLRKSGAPRPATPTDDSALED